MERTSNCHVTVSLPYSRCKRQIRRAVESILGQTHTDLTLVVINDGDDDPPWDWLADICDSRLVRFDLASHHGEYFADAVVLNATADPYFLVQNADDWSEPERISLLLEIMREDHADAALSAEYQYSMIDGKVVSKVKKGYAAINRSLTYSFENRAAYRGLFRTEALREIGGTYAGFHIGYSVLLIHFLLMTGRISYIDDPLYHRVIQSDAFKQDIKQDIGTRIRSATRKEVALQLEKLYHEAFELYIEYLAGQIEVKTLARLIRQLCDRGVTQKDRDDLLEESHCLRTILASCAYEPVGYRIMQHGGETAGIDSAKQPTDIVAGSKTKWTTGRPFASVIIPTYDDDLRLEWLLEGLCCQTVKDFEVIVVNDAGPSSTEELVNLFTDRLDISYYYFGRPKLEQRTGATRNYGVRYSVGELLVFLDADMVPDPDLIEAHSAHYLADVVLFGHRRFYPMELVHPFVPPLDYKEFYSHSAPDWRFTPEVRRNMRQWHQHFFGCNCSIPARIYYELGGHDERFEGWSSEDLDIGYRIAMSGYGIYPLWGIGMGTHLGHPPRPRSSIPQTWQCNPNEPLCRNGGPFTRLFD